MVLSEGPLCPYAVSIDNTPSFVVYVSLTSAQPRQKLVAAPTLKKFSPLKAGFFMGMFEFSTLPLGGRGERVHRACSRGRESEVCRRKGKVPCP